MKTAAGLLGGLAFSAIYVSCSSSSHSQGANWGGVLFGIILGIVAAFLNGAAESQEQVTKDTDAYERAADVLAGKDRYFYLYLRPFSVTNKMQLKSIRVEPIQDSLKPKPTRTFEAALERGLQAWGIPLIALGKPGEAIGAGRIRATDENWQMTFNSLARVATGFIVVPAESSGTWWEIDWLVRNKMLHKTIFVFQYNDIQSAKEIAQQYSDLGIRLPDDGVPCFAKLSEEGNVIARIPIDVLHEAYGGKAIQDLMHLATDDKHRVDESAVDSNLAPDDAAYKRALCYVRLGYYRDAARWYEEAIRRNPKRDDVDELRRRIQALTQ